jgi:hypothetical protein
MERVIDGILRAIKLIELGAPNELVIHELELVIRRLQQK